MQSSYWNNKKLAVGVNLILLVLIIVSLALITALSDLSMSTLSIIFLVMFIMLALFLYTFQLAINRENIEQHTLLIDSNQL